MRTGTEVASPPDNATELADLYLTACAAGLPCTDLAVGLANALAESGAAALSREVLAGGPLLHARATQLAEQTLAEARKAPAKNTRNG